MTMDENGGANNSLLGDITYEPPKPRQTLPDGTDPRLANAERPVLDDFDAPQSFARPAQNAGGVDPRLAGAVAPILDDMGGSAPPPPKPVQQYQELTDGQIAILQQQRAAAGKPPYTQEEIDNLKAEFIERQRLQAQQAALAQQAAQQQAAQQANILLEETTYSAPEKKTVDERLPQVDASALLEEPAPEPERRVVFNQEDLEAAKKNAAKRAVESLNEAPKPDSAESRKQLQELRRQQQADLAKGGFLVSLIATVIGFIAGAAMLGFAIRPFATEEVNGFFTFMCTFYKVVGIILMILSITIVTRVQPLKGKVSLLFGLSAFLLFLPGIIVLFDKKDADGFAFTAILYVLGLIGCFAVTFMISTSDKLTAYYAKKDIFYD